VVFFILFLASCGVRKTVPKGRHIVTKNQFDVSTDKLLDINLKSEIQSQVLYKPNRRVFLGRVPFFLWLYATGTKNKNPEMSDSTRWRRYLRKQGEPPVLLDSNKVSLNVSNIKTYLFTKGYFLSEVSYEVAIKKHKAKVKYIVKPLKPFIINSVFYASEDPALLGPLKSICDSINGQTKILSPWKASADILAFTDMRQEIVKRIRNKGYYAFNVSNITVQLDTFREKRECAVYINLGNNPGQSQHYLYNFTKPNFTIDVGKAQLDTIKYPKQLQVDGKNLLLNHYRINPVTVAKLIYTDSAALFNQTNIEQTYQSLLEMNLFSYVDIRAIPDTISHTVQVNIYARSFNRLTARWEPQGLYSPQGNLGTSVSTNNRSFGLAMLLSLSDRNLFGNAESLTISSLTSAEAIFKRGALDNFRYGLQQGFNASLILPHFNLLNNLTKKSSFHSRKTIISASFQFEDNPNFRRQTIPAGLTFKFEKPGLSLFYTPVEVSYLFAESDPAFLKSLSNVDSAFASKVLFTPLFIMATKLGIVYSKGLNNKTDNNLYIRAAVETSGNSIRWLSSVADPNFISNKTYSVFGVQLSRYVRGEFEVRYRKDLDELNTVVFKFNTGVGVPFGNGEANYLPYDKRFFIGGSNSLRGWRPRRVGPGLEPLSANIIDKSGEMLIEASAEYRFTLLRNFLYGAVFADAGNIWNINHQYAQAGTKGIFNPETYFNELAFNTGIGSRFDFGFFLFRLDWGWPLHDPTKSASDRWVANKFFSANYFKDESALTIGIGYPF